jgi:hypothetical protein
VISRGKRAKGEGAEGREGIGEAQRCEGVGEKQIEERE